jgi:Tol biopolymer transport system component
LLPLLLLACQAVSPPAAPAPARSTPRAATTPTQAPVQELAVDLSSSPDGQWKAAWSGSDMSLHVTDGAVAWKTAFDPQRFGWDNGELRPYRWSADGQFLYVLIFPSADHACTMDGSGLLKLNLADGSLTEVLLGKGRLYALALSPDETHLAYVECAGWQGLIVRDLQTGQEVRSQWTEEPKLASGIVWSPTSDAMVFSMQAALTDAQGVLVGWRSLLVRADGPAWTQITLNEGRESYQPIAWPEANRVLLRSRAEQIWQLVLDTGQLTPTTSNGAPSAATQIYVSEQFSITMEYPADWRPGNPDDGALFRGEDGFFGLSSAYMVAETVETVCALELESNARTDKNPNQRFGSRPNVEHLQVNGQPACLILPSNDQQPPDGGALLFVQYPTAYEHNRTLMLSADRAHIRQIGASLRFSPPRQTLDSLQDSMTFVELDVFSGRPNPIWSLPDAQRKELLARLAGLPPSTLARYPDRLGYRGLLVHFNLPPYGMPETIQVFQGTVCYALGGTRTCRVDAGREVERWLLAMADRSQVDVELLDSLLNEISAVATVQASGQPKTRPYASPDQQWRVDITVIDCVPTEDGGSNAFETLSLARSTGVGAVVVDSQLINCGGLGAYGLGGLFWSPNSRYFYYTTAREGVPDGCGYWQPPIWRLDAPSGMIQELGGGLRSLDGAKLAAWLNRELIVWDIDGDELGRWPAVAPNVALATLTWSPDGKAVAYLLAPSLCDPNSSGKSYVVRINVADLSQSILLETETTFTGLEWVAPNVIRLFDDDGKSWLLDENGLNVEATP